MLLRAQQWLLPIIVVITTPILFTKELWYEIWSGSLPQAWDGSGHHALAQYYSQTLFPSTFGWAHAFFGGIPFPNFYPPLFYWLVALLDRTHLLSFPTVFKIVLIVPVVLLPAAVWTLAWKVSNKNQLVAIAAALAILPLLIDYRFFNSTGLMGLNYASTFLLGMYSQTLGFILLIAWYVLFSSKCIYQPWRFALSSILLALALLANFFGAITAALLVLSTIVYDSLKLVRKDDIVTHRQTQKTLAAHAFSSVIAGCLTLFWSMPLIASYDYFVTRPHSIAFDKLVPAVMWVWYTLALAGIIVWLRRPTRSMWPYLTTCLALASGVFFAAAFSPRWFPLHPPRLITTLNFLLAVPVGMATAAALRQLSKKFFKRPLQKQPRRNSRALSRRELSMGDGMQSRSFGIIVGSLILLIGIVVSINWITPSDYSLAFYQTGNNERINPVLRFAERHRAGRYLVEVPPFSDVESSLDARAINSYLGAQGNEAVSLFFREAAPNVLFFNPLVNALSTQPDAFGISSVLVDDRDFAEQPLSHHLERARFVGVRYLVMTTPVMKNRLANETIVEARHHLGAWSVFDIGGGGDHQEEQVTPARPLAYRPALVIGDFSFKMRRREEYDFVRFAEEQFNGNWFDVLLARSLEPQIDRLSSLEDFGAVIVDTYKYDDEVRAFELLRDYAQRRKLILLTSDSPLFHRIRSSISQFPQAHIIDRPLGAASGEWLEANRPTFNYGTSAVRRVWREIQQTLDQSKVAVDSEGEIPVKSEKMPLAITIIPGSSTGPSERVPVLISTTYHPNWQRTDGEAIYPATPFFMLTFVREPVQLVFARRPLDWAGFVASAVTLFLLCGYMLWCYGPRTARFASHKVFPKTGRADPLATDHARRSV